MSDIPHDILNNNIEASEPFKYPDDVEAEAEEIAEKIVQTKLNELLTRIAIIVLPSRNPHLAFISLFFAAGVDLSLILNCENSEAALAKKLGIAKQTVSLCVKNIRKQLNLVHSTTLDYGKQGGAYSNNSKKPKIL